MSNFTYDMTAMFSCHMQKNYHEKMVIPNIQAQYSDDFFPITSSNTCWNIPTASLSQSDDQIDKEWPLWYFPDQIKCISLHTTIPNT